MRRIRRAYDPVQPTFDVFDTVLTYTVVPPKMVWSEVARAAASLGLIDDATGFHALRRRAPAEVRLHGGSDTLESIYAIIGDQLELTSQELRELIRLELGVTATCLLPVPGGRRLLEGSRSGTVDGSVIFISDMYLPSRFIREQLVLHNLWRDGDQLWVSGEAGARKADASLFRHVEVSESRRRGRVRFVHTGDHPSPTDRQRAGPASRRDRSPKRCPPP